MIGGVNGETLDITYSSTTTTSNAPATYVITGTLANGNGTLSNYTVTLTPGTLTVNKASINYSLTDAQAYGSPANLAHDLGATVNGVNGEILDVTYRRRQVPPCQNKCPIREDIQRTNVLISLLPEDPKEAREGVLQIGDSLYERNPFFTVCGYICGICERECNYKTKGGSIKRRLLKRFLSDTYTPFLKEKKPIEAAKTGIKVAVIGGGPGGLMCAWEMAKKGHDVTVFDNNPKLGGAIRYIPKYRLPEDVLDAAVDSLVRIGGIKVEKNVKLEGDVITKLKEQGFKVFCVATGTPYPRPLTFGVDKIEWQGMEGVGYGLSMLDEAGRGLLPPDYYKGKRVVVIGGGNVAFDAARTAYRLGGQVTVVCLENEDKSTPGRHPG